MACANGARRLVLISPFYSGRDIARRVAPWLPAARGRDSFRTDLVLGSCDLPVTLFFGGSDTTIPAEASSRLLGILGARDELVVLPGVGHSDVGESGEFQGRMTRLLNPESQ